MTLNIGLIDADLLWSNTRSPNLALMKLSAHLKGTGDTVSLLQTCDNLDRFNCVYVSAVFDYTPIPAGLFHRSNVTIGGTGFFADKAQDLPNEIEHNMPDYHLYDEWVAREMSRGILRSHFNDYIDYSIGFTTRGCFRKCLFCVNRKYDHAFYHSPVAEFFDSSRKYICLWDDNVLAYPGWHGVFDELASTGHRFQFRQGLDIRLLNDEKAKVLSEARYIGDYIFAFDFLQDKDAIEPKLKLWRQHSQATTKVYVLCGYESTDVSDIISVLERVRILMGYRCVPYLMRYSGWNNSPFSGLYTELARWCNQPAFFKKKSFREFCEANAKSSSGSSMSVIRLTEFESQHPGLARAYFDRCFDSEPVRF